MTFEGVPSLDLDFFFRSEIILKTIFITLGLVFILFFLKYTGVPDFARRVLFVRFTRLG
jgi:hypothetical protein